MRILVAGATGVLGSATVPLLIEAGHEVHAVSRRAESDEALQFAGAQPHRLDVFDRGAVAEAARDMDAVINIATHIPPPTAAWRHSAWDDNHRLRRDASRVLADAALSAGARFVQESFAPTYADNGDEWINEDHPLDPIGQTASVVDAETSARLVTDGGGTGVVLRFGLFYGRGTPDAKRFLDMARKGRLLLPGPADRYSSMIFVDDAAAAVVAALDLPAGTYNVVEDEPMTRADHAAVLAQLVGRAQVKPLPAAVGRVWALRVLARSHRISNARLREASSWTPSAPSVREGWAAVVADEMA